MKEIGKPKISEYSSDKSEFTSVTFEPDLKKFHMKSFDSDIVSLFKKRVYDIAGCTPSSVNVYLNGKKIDKVKNFESYIDMYLTEDERKSKVFEKINERWEVCVIPSSFD